MVSWWRINQKFGYDGSYIGEGKAWGLAPKDLCDGEEQVNAWIWWIKVTMENLMFLSINYLYLWIKKMRWHG
jgi:hypothetical protein